jgi:transcriptional regulator with XRE-family HTH domain
MSENNHPLARYRRERRMTQEALAGELGVSPHTVWRWENGERTPRPKEAKRVSNHTGIPAGDLLAASLQVEENVP